MTARGRRIGVRAGAGAWWLMVAVPFLLTRGEDVGRRPTRLATSLARLVHEPVWGRAGIQSLIGLLIAALVGLAWYGRGETIVRRADPAEGESDAIPVMHGATRSLVGAGACSLASVFLGVLHLYRGSR